MKKSLLILISICSLYILSACGAGGNGGGGGPAIQVAIATRGGLQTIDVLQPLSVTATAMNAVNNTGFDWTLSCGGGACGTIAAHTASGAPATFTVPGALPSTPVTTTATPTGEATLNATRWGLRLHRRLHLPERLRPPLLAARTVSSSRPTAER